MALKRKKTMFSSVIFPLLLIGVSIFGINYYLNNQNDIVIPKPNEIIKSEKLSKDPSKFEIISKVLLNKVEIKSVIIDNDSLIQITDSTKMDSVNVSWIICKNKLFGF